MYLCTDQFCPISSRESDYKACARHILNFNRYGDLFELSAQDTDDYIGKWEN